MINNTVYDANGRIDPGETADFTATLVNIGGADLTNLSTTIQTSSSYITINDGAGYFGDLLIDEIKENTSDPYTVTASSSTPVGASIDFLLIATADGGFCDTSDFRLTIGENAPTDTGYYYCYYSGGPHINCPVYSWIAIDSTQTANPGTSMDLGDNQISVVSFPFTFKYYGVNYNQISVSSNGWIGMGFQSSVDWTNSSIPNPDGPSAMIAGLWDDLDPGNTGAPSDVYYYYDATNHIFVVEYFQVEHWPSGAMETFEIIFYDPAYYFSPTGDGDIIVQYLVEQQQWDNTLGIENSGENLGIEYFYNDVYHMNAAEVTDEFSIRYTTWPPDQNPGIEEYEAATTPLNNSFAVVPSITKSGVSISYMLGHGNKASLSIYDASGRLVRSFNRFDREATVIWDCRDAAGHKVSSGVYFVKLESDTYQDAHKVIVVD
ncbi:MAG: T9SS type A sorting domain-containing protein [bacterium]